MRANEFLPEKWSQKYKSSINCSNPKGFSQRAHCQGRKKHEESAGDRGDIPTGPNAPLIPFPQGTSMIDVSDVYDWYKLGMVISDLDDADPKIFGQGAPHTVIAFGSEEEEHKFVPLLKKLGLSVHDIDRPEDIQKAVPAKMFMKDLAETIRKVKGGYRLVSKKGKNLGTYPSKSGAEKRERQVQYFKHLGEAILSELNINQTLKFIKQAHGDQLYGKLPYWTHPRAVAMTGKKIFGAKFNSDAVKVAFLHDVVEDTDIGIDELSKLEFSPKVIEAVSLLTKDKSLTYRQNIEKIISSGNPLAMMVKYADNFENYSGDKSTWDPAKAASSQKKYLMSLTMLGNKLGVKHHEQTDEGWKDWLGGAAIGAAVATGGPSVHSAIKDINKPEPQIQQVQKQEKPQQIQVQKSAEVKPDALPKKSVTGSPHEKILTKAAAAAGIKGEELAQFLAQTAHETGNFEHMVELGGSLDFKKYEPKFVKDKKTGKLVNMNPKAKALGNTKPGDGTRYKGRGYIQLTGKYNYKRAGEALGLDLVNKPELVEKPEIAAKVAVWYWQNRVQPKVDNFDNTRAVTKPINSGLKGLSDREEKFQSFKVAMR